MVPDDPPPSYQAESPVTPKRKLSILRSHSTSKPELPEGLVFNIYRSSPLLSRKVYDITNADKRTQAFHVTFPYTALGLSSRPNILVQRGGSSGTVIGEVRYHSMHPDEIVLPASGSPNGPASTKMSSDGLFTSRKRITLGGQDYQWRHVSNRADAGRDAGGDDAANSPISGRWKCTNQHGSVFVRLARTTSAKKVGRITITQPGLSDQEIEAFVVTALAVLEKDARRGSDSGNVGD
ncbi:MAG: hypothetical protein INR71_15115 [Terriglobus roseus]|nr:hypothetical protein [Terriglobus roseus]